VVAALRAAREHWSVPVIDASVLVDYLAGG
jgi:hypothetical protein